MANISPPKYVRHILTTLQSRGCPAYLVGGCVRDMLLGVRPQDWDICTGALPEQVMEIFPGSLPIGIKHGTVTVKVNSRLVEVTTFRRESAYSDHRHPDMVSFVGDLTTDLSRRDFTVNAMALSVDGFISDPFGGTEDIQRRLIRCVGAPEKRFGEDALRMLRALRFSAKLGFDIEGQTMAAIEKKAPLAAELAPERVRVELEKLILSPEPEKAFLAFKLGLMESYTVCRPIREDAWHGLRHLPKKPLYRWAALCELLAGEGCVKSAEEFLTALRLDGRTLRCCASAGELLSVEMPQSPVEWKRRLRDHGVDAVSVAAAVSDALRGGNRRKELKAVLKSGECFSMKHLAVTGDDLLSLGLEGRELGNMLEFLLDYVIEFPGFNRRELLLSLATGTEDQ